MATKGMTSFFSLLKSPGAMKSQSWKSTQGAARKSPP